MQANDCMSVLKTLRNDNSNKLIFAHININSIRNKFEFLSAQETGNIIQGRIQGSSSYANDEVVFLPMKC